MFAELLVSGEAQVTEWTAEAVLMGLHVVSQVGSAREHLAALGAAERFHSRMAPQVSQQIRVLGKAFATQRAAEGFLSCVRPHMAHQMIPAAESSATTGAAERFFVRITSHIAHRDFISVQSVDTWLKFPAVLPPIISVFSLWF